jgi:Ca2+-binding RTX toxin-like protein
MTTLTGTAGDDNLVGGVGDDVFELEDGGADTAHGGDGDDSFRFGASLTDADRVDGGGGFNTVYFVATEPLALTGAMLTRIDRIVFQSDIDGQVTLSDEVVAAGRKLSVRGTELDNYGLLFDGSAETDGELSIVGSAIDDNMSAGGGADTLSGGKGIDTLGGGGGADRIVGGADRDVLTGGDGVDVFLYGAITDSRRNSPDSITDLEEQDVIDLRAIDANALKDGNQAFHLTDHYGEAGAAIVHYNIADAHWVLLLDVDGDSRDDGRIDLGILEFTPSNFVL